MSFARQQKRLNEPQAYNPPPGYYQIDAKTSKLASSFARGGRFNKTDSTSVPGPGSYYDHHKQQVRKRMIEESQHRQTKAGDRAGSNNIKISSIPSIPKKSATRVYQELAPGILILHEQEYQNTSIGPGSYNIADRLVRPKQIAHKIAPQHPIKAKEEQPAQVNVPSIAEQIRNEKRLMYKQNIVKSSTVNKNEINPSDLCLEVIILREKLLRSDQNPPPGYYHNEKAMSTFKKPDEQRLAENQHLGGHEKRFQQAVEQTEGGPAAYSVQGEINLKGGFIPKQPRRIHPQGEQKPGPGSYINEKPKMRQENKASYPPIFGSGCVRFMSAPKVIEPGPGSYKIDKKSKKKQKHIKIKRELLQPNRTQPQNQPIFGVQNDYSQISQMDFTKERHFYQVDKNTSNFASKVQRFAIDSSMQVDLGPGNYDIPKTDFCLKTFNRRNEGYAGSRGVRFDQYEIRPKIGPGTYNPAYDTVKQRKIANVFL